ncbi:hypothetical protein [Actibacterium lipolyticum]|uniref:Uncharacterized protein n=1 Tax=Actibacterium lipolyticum TaxID=1524263 RepID=A0A238KMU2_9RHOB|nr:hypothetical protein [Actibacterium lipolyticum]SMX43980.1 hypothetical protein COL8621_02428 [Actibacterium lipolyticum]
MKTLALTTAIILGVAAPVLAGGPTASQIQEQIALESDDGNERFFAEYVAERGTTHGTVVVSSRNTAGNSADQIFARIAAESDDSNERFFAGSPVTVFHSAGGVNAKAVEIFAKLAAED